MAQKSKTRQRIQQRNIPWGSIGLVVAGLALAVLIGYAIWDSFQPVPILGEAVPIAGAEHIPNGQKATDYNSDPPTSGQHYDEPAAAGFYDEAPADEHLVHSLEHGYIVLYYNCTNLDEAGCQELKDEIRSAMPKAGVANNTRTPKIIAAPRLTMDNLVTYTSWGRIYSADDFSEDEFLSYVEQNRNKAPEPQAP